MENEPVGHPRFNFRGARKQICLCKDNSIIGIGWAGYIDDAPNETSADYKSFLKAKNALLTFFRIGAMIWAKDSFTKYHYLCVVTSEIMKANDTSFHAHDVGFFCQCSFLQCFEEGQLPDGIEPCALVVRSTILKVSKLTYAATLKCKNTVLDDNQQ